MGRGTWGWLACAGSVGSGHTYVLGSRGGTQAPSRVGMAHGADPLGREHAGARNLGLTRECTWVNWHYWLDRLETWLVWVIDQ
jgi:hypothetical protein